MKKLLLIMFCMLACFAQAQQVTKTVHKKAVKTDVVTTGTMTIRKPDYICISTDNDRDLLMMDATKFTITIGGKRHTTDNRNNPQFTTFHDVLTAVINGQPIPQTDDMTITTKGGQKTITITPVGKKRQLFTSFVLTLDTKTSAIVHLRMNARGEDYINYDFK